MTARGYKIRESGKKWLLGGMSLRIGPGNSLICHITQHAQLNCIWIKTFGQSMAFHLS